MANRIEVFDVTTAAGVSSSSPTVTALAFSDGEIVAVELVFPTGCAGLVGLQLAYAGQVVIPHSRVAFIRADDDVIRWPVEGYPTGGAWAARTYNTDNFPHTLQLRFLIDELGPVAAARMQVATIPAAAIESVPVG